MFYLRDLPDTQTLHKFSKKYPDLDVHALTACALLSRAGSDIIRLLEKFLSKHNLSQGRFIALIVMNRDPDAPISPTVLAEKMGVTKSTVSGLLDGLVKDGLVERNLVENDRRRNTVMLTSRGSQVLDKLLPEYYIMSSKVMSGLDSHQKSALISLLTRVEFELGKVR